MRDSEKMELALTLAQEALDGGEMPIAAVVFRGDEIVAQAFTSETADRRKMQLFTTLEPCLMCYGAAMSFFIGEIVYSLAAPDDGATRLVDFGRFSGDLVRRQRPVMRGGLLEERARAQLQAYLGTRPPEHLAAFVKGLLEGAARQA